MQNYFIRHLPPTSPAFCLRSTLVIPYLVDGQLSASHADARKPHSTSQPCFNQEFYNRLSPLRALLIHTNTMEQSRSPSTSRSVDEAARKGTKRSDVACERCHKNKTVCIADNPLSQTGSGLRAFSGVRRACRSPEMLVSFSTPGPKC